MFKPECDYNIVFCAKCRSYANAKNNWHHYYVFTNPVQNIMYYRIGRRWSVPRDFFRCEREGPVKVLGCVKAVESICCMSDDCTGWAEETEELKSLGGKRNHKQVFELQMNHFPNSKSEPQMSCSQKGRCSQQNSTWAILLKKMIKIS